MLSAAKDWGFFYLFSDVMIDSHLILSMKGDMTARLWSGPTTNSTLLLECSPNGKAVTNGVSVVNGQAVNFATHGQTSEVWLQVLAPGEGSISYGFAGTNNAEGLNFTDTLKVNAYREKLYVHISEMAGLTNMPSFNASALAKYDISNVMTQVVAFCADPEVGIGLDIEWVRDDLVFNDQPLKDTNGNILAPNTYRHNGKVHLPGDTNNTIIGSGFLMRDLRVRSLDRDVFNRTYFTGHMLFAQKVLLPSTRRGDLPKHVRLCLIDRIVEIEELDPSVADPSALIVDSHAFASFGASTPFEECGAVVSVVGMAEERNYTAPQFINRLAWVIAHEIGHLIIREQDGNGWIGNHRDSVDTLMANIVASPKGLSDVNADLEEISKINLANKASVQEQ